MSLLDEFITALGHSKDMSVADALNLILAKARRHTSAEAGSIFMARPIGGTPTELQAFSVQNDRIAVTHEMFTIPVDKTSIAGYVASTGEILEIDDLYILPPDSPFRFNRAYDDRDGYRSKSMLTFPLKNFQGQIIGVVQLLNHISGVDDQGEPQYEPFPISFVDDMKGIMTMLGVMVERIELRAEIERLQRQVAELTSQINDQVTNA